MKAVIRTGSKQYVVSKDDELEVELVGDKKTLEFAPLAIIDEKGSKIGTPEVSGAKVKATVLEADKAGEKVKIRKFQSKKRVNTLTGHRQHLSRIKITAIEAK